MLDADKKPFWVLVNMTMEMTNHYPLTKETIIGWWHKLKDYDLLTVEKALNAWTDTTNKPPTPFDIKSLCKPKAEIYTALSAPKNENSHQYADNVVKYINEIKQPKTDYKAWAKRIIANPEKFRPESLVEAKKAMGLAV